MSLYQPLFDTEELVIIALGTTFDAFVLLMTLLKTLRHVSKMYHLGLPMGISSILVRDGEQFIIQSLWVHI